MVLLQQSGTASSFPTVRSAERQLEAGPRTADPSGASTTRFCDRLPAEPRYRVNDMLFATQG
jgi:hypothetical protein